MTRIALLGNSHLAAWKLGWDEMKGGFPDVEITFFAANGDSLSVFRPEADRLVLDNDSVAALVATTSGGKRDIVVADYDFFCIVGLKYGISVVAALYPRWRSDSHKGIEGRFTTISDGCFQATVRDSLDDTPAMHLVRKLRALTDKLIVIGVQPAPCEAIVKITSGGILPAINAADDVRLRSTYHAVSAAFEADNLMILDQPPSTLASPLLSKDAFQRGRRHTADLTHLNGAYGAIALADMLSRVDRARLAA